MKVFLSSDMEGTAGLSTGRSAWATGQRRRPGAGCCWPR